MGDTDFDGFKFVFNPYLYDLNATGLSDIAKDLQQQKISFALYEQPYPFDISFPYADEDDQKYHQLLAKLGENGVKIFDLTHTMPNNVWGLLNVRGAARKDFFHFNAQGHQLLADQLDNTIQNWIRN